MKKILIVGTSGCGKTTLAKKLEKSLRIKATDLDDYFWLPNWTPKDKDEFYSIVDKLTTNDQWIVCGNYSQVQDMTMDKCDTIIWLDCSLYVCLSRVIMRSMNRVIYKEICCNGNYETFKRLFSFKDSIILWVLKTYHRRRAFYDNVFKNSLPGKIYIKFSNNKECDDWLESKILN